ncbi:Uncharacterised protein [Mycobacteroides abscessus subsp. abscessus]|nr:Uncharacterised protein [Mycobacteroides abscessus subsp. abscessus]
MAAAGGRPKKNAVSKTATCGTSGSRRRATSMPCTPAGLCSGAREDSSAICATTASSSTVGS